MTFKFIVDDLAGILARRELPTVTTWSRLEGRPRAENFDRALKAEVSDALWMITRQLQMGEVTGDDAASPISVRLRQELAPILRYQAGSAPPEAFDDSLPLETRVERRPLPLAQGGVQLSLDLRLLMGRQWLKLLASIGDFAAEVKARYPVRAPDPGVTGDAPYCAHPVSWATFAAAAGRCMDGAALYAYLKADPGHHAYDGIAGLAGHAADVEVLAARFVAWVEALIAQPPSQDAWVPERLEYQFACSAPRRGGETVLEAERYHHGHLDWYSVDGDSSAAPLGIDPAAAPEGQTQEMLPARISFNGMPDTRWWAFEDGRTNFGEVKPDTTDLAKLLLIEFGLVYANDWFMVPISVPPGRLISVRGLVVTDVFGDRTWVDVAGTGQGWQRWSMFRLDDVRPDGPATPGLLLPPVAQKVEDGPPCEEVMLVRDEIANMVWGVECTIPLPSGESKPGSEAARELRAFYEADLLRRLGGAAPSPPAPPAEAKIRYRVMNSIPENWIPFVPVHVPGDVRSIQLQRAAMPRILEGDPAALPARIHPRTSLLREGIDAGQPWFVHEEEVSRAGTRLIQRYRRTRWRDGRAWVWLARTKQTGRGEGASGLTFDQVEPEPPQS